MNGPLAASAIASAWPGLFVLFGLAFGWAWSIEKKRHYLLLLTAACLLFATAAFMQIMLLPLDIGANTIPTGLLYTLAVLAAAEAILRRSGRGMGWKAALGAIGVITALLWYFYYIRPNLLVRIYVQAFGYGLILAAAAWRIRALRHGRLVDRVLFWVVAVVAIHFFPRTWLTFGTDATASIEAFGASLFWNMMQLLIAAAGTALAFALLAAALTDVIDDLRRERDVDPLTGVLNRRGLEERVARLFRNAGAPLSLILCDIDHFKAINDAHGHAAGDRVLATFAGVLRDSVREADLVARIGGEEFAILLPGMDVDAAMAVAECIRERLAIHRFPVLGATESVTASFGLAQRDGSERFQAFSARADARLYRAKREGRDRVVAADMPLTAGPAEVAQQANAASPAA
ncbi:UNVERIFIED_ORG: diguanylate cyclase (GGDEF)-like protein [Ensifer adhaerens]|nr:diguanylate cyclase (GGDEF)-like protein [Ensifer adhaerens]